MKILIADDHALFREGLRYMLQELEDSVQVLETRSASEAMDTVARNDDLDLILLDLSMPGLDGFAGLRMLRERFPEIPVVVVSASEDPEDVRRALNGDASGYIPKSTTGRDMLDALRHVLDGEIYVPTIDPDGSVPPRTSAPDPGAASAGEAIAAQMTPRQREVLALMCEGHSNKAIARILGMAEGTVKIHVTAILQAMNVSNRTQAVILAGQLGLASQR
jgi:DNA-binding NarL/FixJ family response regulator